MSRSLLRPAPLGGLLFGLLAVLLAAGRPVRGQGPIMPGGYHLPGYLQTITLKPVFRAEPLRAAARKVVRETAGVRSGERVVILSDPTINPLLAEAFEAELKEAAARVEIRSAPAPSGSDAASLLAEAHWRDPWPETAWASLRGADVILALSYLNLEFVRERLLKAAGFPREVRFVSVTAVPELLAGPASEYPRKIVDLLAEKVRSQLEGAESLRITDPAGTELTLQPAGMMPSRTDIRVFPHNVEVGVLPGSQAKGVLVTHAASTGFLPLLRVGIDHSRVASIQGGGEIGEILKAEPSAFGLRSISWAMNPRSVRLPKRLSGSPAAHNQVSSGGRAGAMRVGFWEEDPARSVYFQVYFPTVWADGREVIREGFPLALRDPELVRLAESLGGPELLKVQCTVLPGALPEPRVPEVAESIGPDQLQPALDRLIGRVARIRPDEKVLVLTDESVPPLVVQSLEERLKPIGSEVRILSIPVPSADPDALALLQAGMGRSLPDGVREEVARADVVLSPSYFEPGALAVPGRSPQEWLQEVGTRWVGLPAVPELLASPWATFPEPLLDLIAAKVEGELKQEVTIILSNNQGTSLIYDYEWVREAGDGPWKVFPETIRFRIVPRDTLVEGVLVASSVLTGRIPRTEIHIADGRVIEVQGSAATSRAVKEAVAQGGGFLEVSFGIHPLAFPLPDAPAGFSPRLWSSFAASQRSGVVSVLLGSPEDPAGRLPLQMVFPHLNAGGTRILVDLGHLAALDDEEVSRLSEQLGSREELLEERWIPSPGE